VTKQRKVKSLKVVLMVTRLRAMERHLPYGITKCLYQPTDSGEQALP